MGSKEKRALKQIDETISDWELDLDLIGIYLSNLPASSSTYNRLMIILDAATEEMKAKKYTMSESKRAFEAEKLLLSAQKGSSRSVSTIYGKHAFEDDQCQLCEWISDEMEMGEEWLFEAVIGNPNCPDSLLRKMIEEFSTSPAAWGVAGAIELNPNASAKTKELVSKYMESFD